MWKSGQAADTTAVNVGCNSDCSSMIERFHSFSEQISEGRRGLFLFRYHSEVSSRFFSLVVRYDSYVKLPLPYGIQHYPFHL